MIRDKKHGEDSFKIGAPLLPFVSGEYSVWVQHGRETDVIYWLRHVLAVEYKAVFLISLSLLSKSNCENELNEVMYLTAYGNLSKRLLIIAVFSSNIWHVLPCFLSATMSRSLEVISLFSSPLPPSKRIVLVIYSEYFICCLLLLRFCTLLLMKTLLSWWSSKFLSKHLFQFSLITCSITLYKAITVLLVPTYKDKAPIIPLLSIESTFWNTRARWRRVPRATHDTDIGAD